MDETTKIIALVMRDDKEYIYPGLNHSRCLKYYESKNLDNQGMLHKKILYMTNYGDVVDCGEAFEIATSAGQIHVRDPGSFDQATGYMMGFMGEAKKLIYREHTNMPRYITPQTKRDSRQLNIK
ncbi:MAG: hypothetical protein FWC00_05955 [Firmicutes bacterium]|nr:hypothetical protein [Bacillota bacterium]